MTKVLLVEDDNNLREIYEARLAAEGYEISAAQDGEEALEVAKKIQPDLIISDVMMPRISGFEMLDILRNTQGLQHTKVIMLTALGQEEDKTRADSLGADRYLVKSQVTLEDIVKAADELLNGEPAPETTDVAAQQPSEELSPIAPPNIAAAAHSVGPQPDAAPQQTLSAVENGQQPQAYTPNPLATAPIQQPVTPEVASDPVASNDQALQEAVQALATEPVAAPEPAAQLAEPAVAPAPTPEVQPVAPPSVEVAAPAPELTPAPAVEPVTTVSEPLAAVEPQPVAPVAPVQPQPAVTPPEAIRPEMPSLPEIERAMELPTPPTQGVVNGFPGVVTPTEPTPTVPPAVDTAAPTPELTPAPEPAPAEPAPETPSTDFTRPTIGGATASPEPTAPSALPETQTTAQEASTVNDQINSFMNQFPNNVGEIVEAPGTPDATATAPPAPEPVAPVEPLATIQQPLAPEPAPAEPAAVAPSTTPQTGGQRTIQPLASTAPAVDIHELAAREGSVEPPAGTPNLPNQPGGVFTPNSNGSAQDAAL